MHTKRIRLLFLFVCFGCLFLCSCGLDEYYVIEPPSASEVSVEQEDPDKMVYTFKSPVVNAVSSSQISMKGIAVYYALYDDKSKLTTDISNVRTKNKEYSEEGFYVIKNNLSYKTMNFTSGSSSSEFLSVSGSQENFEIRMDSTNISSGSGQNISLTVQSGSGTYKVNVEKPGTPGKWYLNAYAVTVGDVSLVEHYSQLALLGVMQFNIQ